MKRNKLNPSYNFLNAKSFLIKFSIVLSLILIAIFLSVLYIKHLALTSDTFIIRDILVPGGKTGDFSYLKGSNIFSFDLKKESRYLSRAFPKYKEVRLIRVLPDKLFIDFLKRKPLAILKLYRNFYLDDTLTLFEGDDSVLDANLAVIKGLEKKIFAPNSGKHYNIPELSLALNILKEAGAYDNLRNSAIKEISFLSPNEATILFSSGLEVKIGEGLLKDKIKLLAGLFRQTPGGISTIKYIDLRFQETVVKFKDAK